LLPGPARTSDHSSPNPSSKHLAARSPKPQTNSLKKRMKNSVNRTRPRLITAICSLALVLLITTGCRTSEPDPSFNAFAPRTEGLAEDIQARHYPQLALLGDEAFQSIHSTNQIPRAWLQPPVNFYKLGPGDVLGIELLGEGTTSSLTVGPDGKIYYSLLPGTFVWGLTLSQTKQLLEASLKEFILGNPQVAVTLTAVASRTVWILGVVQNPGVYTLATPLTLLEAISAAGGTPTAGSEDLADLRNSYVMRDGKLLPINFYKLFRQGDLTQNIYLQPNDLIHLRPAVTREVYVLGAVTLPNMVPFSDHISLLGAIASTGGPVQYARVSKVVLIRGSLTDPKITEVNYNDILKGKAPDVRLEPGDIVYVPFSPYRKLIQFGEAILDQFVTTIAVNEGQNAVLENATPIGVSAGASAP